MFWSFFALLRIILFIHPAPIFLAFIREPLGTYLFFAAGAACLIWWWAVDLRGTVALPSRPAPQTAAVGSFDLPDPDAASAPFCPQCGEQMVVRVARQGPRQGQRFYGCPNFPKCQQTRAI